MKRRRMAPGLLETRGTSPGPAAKKKVSSYTSSSSPRTLSTPGKGTGPRRPKTGPATQTTATTVPHTTPWMVSRWPGSLRTLASTVPMSTSSTRGSWPVNDISKQLQTEPGEAHPPLTDSVGQAVHGLHHQVHHHPEGHQWSRHHHPEQGEDSSATKHHWSPSSPGDPEINKISLENVNIEE